MPSALALRFLGETTDVGSIAPVMTGATVISNPGATAAKRRIPTEKPDKLKKMRNRVVDGIMGRLKEDRDGAVIPSDAKEIRSFDLNDHGLDMKQPEIPGQKIKNPYSGEEPLILPAASLVAPDVTPKAIYPIDPTQLPGADRGRKPAAALTPDNVQSSPTQAPSSPALDVLIGRPAAPGSVAPATPPISAESALASLPGIPSHSQVVVSDSPVLGAALLSSGNPMPDHVANDGGKTILEAFSRFVPRGKFNID